MAAKFPENIKQMTVTHMEAKSPSGFTIIRILTIGYVKEVNDQKKTSKTKCFFSFSVNS